MLLQKFLPLVVAGVVNGDNRKCFFASNLEILKIDADLISVPSRFGYILFPGFAVLDVFGPLEALNELAFARTMNLTLIAENLDPVASGYMSWRTSAVNSTFSESVVPTHTFATAPPLDVLVIPGGTGTRAPSPILNSTIAFVKERYPSLKYLITICTGAGIAARAGVLDGKHATTNKRAWAETTALGPKVKWVAQARWVQDGNIWTSSGVAAGTDAMIAFIEAVYSNATATTVANGME